MPEKWRKLGQKRAENQIQNRSRRTTVCHRKLIFLLFSYFIIWSCMSKQKSSSRSKNLTFFRRKRKFTGCKIEKSMFSLQFYNLNSPAMPLMAWTKTINYALIDLLEGALLQTLQRVKSFLLHTSHYCLFSTSKWPQKMIKGQCYDD